MRLSYDREADVLYINFERLPPDSSIIVENGVGDVLKLERETQRVIGCTIIGLKNRSKRGAIDVPEVGAVGKESLHTESADPVQHSAAPPATLYQQGWKDNLALRAEARRGNYPTARHLKKMGGIAKKHKLEVRDVLDRILEDCIDGYIGGCTPTCGFCHMRGRKRKDGE